MKVLFIDDENSILVISKLIVNSFGYEVITASSGHFATELLSNLEIQKQINIIFLDLTMPGMSGLEVIEWMNKQNITIPTILQTGITDQGEINRASQLGIKDFIIKPYTKEQIHEYIIKYTN